MRYTNPRTLHKNVSNTQTRGIALDEKYRESEVKYFRENV